jgi:hypothetical protein
MLNPVPVPTVTAALFTFFQPVVHLVQKFMLIRTIRAVLVHARHASLATPFFAAKKYITAAGQLEKNVPPTDLS